MRVLVGCEYSGRVREAFRKRGHDAYSCDLLPAEDNSTFHIQGDLLGVIGPHWDLAIFHPPCTDLAVSGARHFKVKQADGRQQAALDFVKKLLDCGIPSIALENPVSIISSKIRKPDQIVQPWMFGHPEQKATCLWLKGLPKLVPTNDVYEHMMTLPKAERERESASNASWTRPLERAQPHLSGHRGCDGSSMGLTTLLTRSKSPA